jgi:PhnB protein
MKRPEIMCPYLNFDGNCEEAMAAYADALDGELECCMYFEGSEAENHVPDHWHGKVLHAQLKIGPWTLMACDAPPGMYTKPQGMHVQITVDNAADAEKIYAALSQGGTVTMKLERTFWAERFGMWVDRFGIPWMINFQGDVQ